jgi:hypothetical protein
MSYSLHDHLYPVVDVPEVEFSVFAQEAQSTLLVQQLWHCIEGQANQTQFNINFLRNIHEPTNVGSDSDGIDTDTPMSFSAPLPDEVYLDPRDWIGDLPTAYGDSSTPLTATRPCPWRPRHGEGNNLPRSDILLSAGARRRRSGGGPGGGCARRPVNTYL